MNKKLNRLGIVFLIFTLLAITINAQEDTYVSTSDVQSQFSDPSIKLSFRSWGEGRETSITLDNYFIGERTQDDRYLQVSPPEIEITIDQETSIATLKARGKWLGTQDVIFTRSSLYNLERSISELGEFESVLVKKRIPPKIKNQFEDLRDKPAYDYLERILDNLEKKKSTEVPDVDASFERNRLSVNVGNDIDLSVGVETDIDGTKTRKPKLDVNVRPEDKIQEEEEELLGGGLPIVVIFPLVLIGGTLLLALIIYFARNKSKFKKIVPKLRTTKPEIIQKHLAQIKEYKKEIKGIQSQLSSIPYEDSAEKTFKIIKNFFNTLTNANYEFTYSEVKKEILDEELSRSTENFLIKFSKELETFRYSNKAATSQGLTTIINKINKAIDLSGKDLAGIHGQEKLKLEKKKPILSLIVNIKNYFLNKKDVFISKKPKAQEIIKPTHKEGTFFLKTSNFFKNLLKIKLHRKHKVKKPIEKHIELKKVERSIIFKKFFHDKFGLFKTQRELDKERQARIQAKINKERARVKLIEEKAKEKIRKKLERRRAIKKFFHDKFGLYKTDRDRKQEAEEKRLLRLEREKVARRIKLEKLKIKRQKRNSVKKFFRDYFGLFKTKEEIEKEIRRHLLEKHKKKLARKKAIIKFFHDKFGLLKTQRELDKEKEERIQKKIRKEKLKFKIAEEKKKARLMRRRVVTQFFHDTFGLFKTTEEKEQIVREKFNRKRKKILARKKAWYGFFHDTLGLKTRSEKEKIRLKEGRLKLKILREKRRLRAERKRIFRKFFKDTLGFYKTQEEKEAIAINKLRTKRRKTIARRKAFRSFLHDKLGLLKTKYEIRLEKEKKENRKIRIKIEKEKLRVTRRKAFRKFLHDTFGLYKTQEELRSIRENERQKRIREEKKKIRKAKASLRNRELRERAIKKFFHDKFNLFQSKAEITKNKLEERLKHEREERLKIRKEKIRAERKADIKKFLHDTLGFYKTKADREEDRELRIKRKKDFKRFLHNKLGFYKTKPERDRDKILSTKRKRDLKKFLHHYLGFYKTKAESDEDYERRKKAFRRFLHDRLGLLKTTAEIKRIKLKERLKLEKEERLKLKKEKLKAERKADFRKFLHDTLGFYKTLREIKKENKKKKIKRLELKNKIINKTGFLKSLFKRKITSSDEIHVLIKLEEDAIRNGEIKKAKSLQKKINKVYKRIEFQKHHPQLAKDYSIVKTKVASLRNTLFSQEEKISFTTRIKNLFSPKIEKQQIDEINYLIKRCEKALANSRKRDAQDLFTRIVHIYEGLNKDSKKAIEKNIMFLRSEIANIIVKNSLKKAQIALSAGKISDARNLYKQVNNNFYYLPLRHRERLIEHKASLAQKLEKNKKKFSIKIPRIPIPELHVLTLLNLQREKIVNAFKSIKFKSSIKIRKPKYKESFTDYLLAKKPKFISITTDTIPKRQIEKNSKRKVSEILKHIASIHIHLRKKDHLKAKEKYRDSVELFRDSLHELPKEAHHIVYKKLKPLKEEILHLSLKNLLSEVQGAVKRGEQETAREIQGKIRAIYSHLTKTSTLPFTPPVNNFIELGELITLAKKEISKRDYDAARKTYYKINGIYNNLNQSQKKEVYSKMLNIYREIIK